MNRTKTARRVPAALTAGLLLAMTLPAAPASAAEPPILYEQQKVVAPSVHSYTLFGRTVAFRGDFALVGAPMNRAQAGTVGAFSRNTAGQWSYQQEIVATDPLGSTDEFGCSIAIDGDTALIGAWKHSTGQSAVKIGAVYVFTRSGDKWTQRAKLLPEGGAPYDLFGASVALEGDTALIGAPTESGSGPGSAYVFTGSGATWTQRAKLTVDDGVAGDSFGGRVALDGGTALISAASRDLPGKDNAGVVYVFTGSGASWQKRAELKAADGAAGDWFGGSIALEDDTAVIGAATVDLPGKSNTGAVYVFTGSGASWVQRAKLTAAVSAESDRFGSAVAISGGSILIGAPGQDDKDPSAGMAYLFTGGENTWTQRASLIASDGAMDDSFGEAIALSCGTALVGAPFHDWVDNTHRGAAYFHSFRSALTPGVTRIAGANRYLTAVESSKRGLPAGGPAVVVATGENWPDALGGSALAGAARGSLLLTRKDSLPAEVLAEVKRLGATKAYVLGSSASVSTAVENTLVARLGRANVVRLGGSDRSATARLVADEAIRLLGGSYGGRAFVATGLNYPDATGASPLAAQGIPILLVPRSSSGFALPGKVKDVVILGSQAAVPATVERDLKALLGDDHVTRLGGANRYATAALVAKWGVHYGMAQRKGIGLATGENFPDALAAGPMLATNKSVLLLTRPTTLPAETRAMLVDFRSYGIDSMFIFGDTNAVSTAVEADARAAAGI